MLEEAQLQLILNKKKYFRQVFTGNGTWKHPAPGKDVYCKISLIGSGGNGGAGGNGGNGGIGGNGYNNAGTYYPGGGGGGGGMGGWGGFGFPGQRKDYIYGNINTDLSVVVALGNNTSVSGGSISCSASKGADGTAGGAAPTAISGTAGTSSTVGAGGCGGVGGVHGSGSIDMSSIFATIGIATPAESLPGVIGSNGTAPNGNGGAGGPGGIMTNPMSNLLINELLKNFQFPDYTERKIPNLTGLTTWIYGPYGAPGSGQTSTATNGLGQGGCSSADFASKMQSLWATFNSEQFYGMGGYGGVPGTGGGGGGGARGHNATVGKAGGAGTVGYAGGLGIPGAVVIECYY